ncbi:MAG: lasso peptide biosynthesis B2 protein [Proteobacteria bacterium]|nr:lasso peptide biosynthesis B2 protein [Pseudomonadota bacterium]
MQKPAYSFPAHIYVCVIQDQGFFLDLKRNDYLSAPLRDLQSLSTSVHDWPSELSAATAPADEVQRDSTIAELTQNHILAEKSKRGRKLESLPGPPARRVLLEHAPSAYPPVFRPHLLSFLKAAVVARYFLSVRSLYSMMCRIEHRRARQIAACRSGDLPAMRRLVEIFRRLQPLLPPTDTPCLVNSVTLLEFLAAYGQFPRLVFGVQAHPFSAHCWIQHEDVVLNSTLEHVLQFTPMNGGRGA